MAKHTDKTTFVATNFDSATGEIKEQSTTFIQAAEPSFVKLYLDCYCAFKGLPQSIPPILLEFLKHMSYADKEQNEGGQIIALNKYIKESIAANTNTSIKRIEQVITQFCKAGIFRRIATGTYQVNPEIIGKGEWKDIKAIRSANFDFHNKTVTVIKEEHKEGENEQISTNSNGIMALDGQISCLK